MEYALAIPRRHWFVPGPPRPSNQPELSTRSLCRLAFSSCSPSLNWRRLKRPEALISGVLSIDCFTTFCSSLINAQARPRNPHVGGNLCCRISRVPVRRTSVCCEARNGLSRDSDKLKFVGDLIHATA